MVSLTNSRKFPAPLAELLRNVQLLRVIIGFLVVQTLLVAAGLPGWPCPLRHGLGIPCPGCGMTRAGVALLQGDWRKSLQYNAFAVVFGLVVVLMCAALFLPARLQESLAQRVAAVERRTGITVLLTVAFLVYWLVRLLIFPDSLALVRQD